MGSGTQHRFFWLESLDGILLPSCRETYMAIKNGAAKTDLQNSQQPQIQQQQQQQSQQQQQQQKQSPESHSVILVTAGYDNTIRFWEALSGICSRTIQHPNSVSWFAVSI
jgi:transcription initiation factor TFIID subunit TAF12